MDSLVLDAAGRVLGAVVAGIVIVVGVFDGTFRYALGVGVVVGVGYAIAAAAAERFGGS